MVVTERICVKATFGPRTFAEPPCISVGTRFCGETRGRRPGTAGAAFSISVVARDSLVALVTLLRLDRHRRDRPRLQPGEADRLAGHFAKAIFAGLDAVKRGVDLGDQLALAVAGAKVDSPIGLARRAISEVGFLDRPAGQGRHRLAGFPHDAVLPGEQLLPEIGELLGIHEFFVGAWTIAADELRIQYVTMKRSHYPSTPRLPARTPGARTRGEGQVCPRI